MAINGRYFAQIIREESLARLVLFEQAIFDEVLPRFADMDERATAAGKLYYAEAGPLRGEFDIDMGEVAEDAFNRGFAVYDALSSIKQMMLNLLATGFFHAAEHQLARACQRATFDQIGPEATIDKIADWIKKGWNVEIKGLPSFAVVNELRLVANAVKHAEGWSAQSLRDRRPELFTSPPIANSGLTGFTPSWPLREPLAGGDLYVTEALMREYCDGAKALFDEIAAELDMSERIAPL